MVRRAEDLPACVEALREAHVVDAYPMAWPADAAAWLTPDGLSRAWIARDGDAVAGHVALVAAGNGASVSRLFVRPSAQGRGLAAALLAAAVEHGVRLGRAVGLDVVEDSAAAIRLYERQGWTLAGTGPASFLRPDGTRPTERRYVAPARLSGPGCTLAP